MCMCVCVLLLVSPGHQKQKKKADEIIELDEKGALERKLKDALEDAADTRGLEDDVKELTFDDKYEEEKVRGRV